MLSRLKNMFKVADLRGKVLFTVVISLTGEGGAVVAAVTRARRDSVAALLRSLPAARREQLVDLLDEFAELAETDACM